MRIVTALLAACPAFPAAPAAAQDDAAIDEVRAAWDACVETQQMFFDGWTGWRRLHDGGYGEFFEFTDGGFEQPAVLNRTVFIDGLVEIAETSCFRADGSLAFILIGMASPNMAQGYDAPSLTREGRVYVAPDGAVLRVLDQTMEQGREVAPDPDRYMLARPCQPAEHYPAADDVRRRIDSVLGDLMGDHPDYTPAELDWCGLAAGAD